MADLRRKDTSWAVADENGKCLGVDYAQLAVLMDIRDELQKLNARLSCHETLAIPRYLRRIARNTAKPRLKKS
jgi:hypothetical protein